jgi:hypothetical protein
MKDIFEDFSWHSAFELEDGDLKKKRIIKKVKASKGNMKKFIKASADSDFLIHKATKALWKFSDDGSSIEPVFEEDILTEEDF